MDDLKIVTTLDGGETVVSTSLLCEKGRWFYQTIVWDLREGRSHNCTENVRQDLAIETHQRMLRDLTLLKQCKPKGGPRVLY